MHRIIKMSGPQRELHAPGTTPCYAAQHGVMIDVVHYFLTHVRRVTQSVYTSHNMCQTRNHHMRRTR